MVGHLGPFLQANLTSDYTDATCPASYPSATSVLPLTPLSNYAFIIFF